MTGITSTPKMSAGNLSRIQKSIEALYPQLSPSFQKMARFVLKEPSKLALYPAREIARDAGVSTSTVVRFSSLLGFESYHAFKNTFREALSSTGAARYGLDARQLLKSSGSDGVGQLWSQTTENLVRRLVDTCNSVQPQELRRAARSLRGAKRVGILGFSGMYPAAFYLRYVLSYVLNDVRLFDDRISTYLEDLPGFDRRDAVLIISFEPYSKDAVAVAQYCGKQRIPLIAVTDTAVSPVARAARQALIVPTSSTVFYQTLVPTLALFEGLIAHVVSEVGEEAVRSVSDKFKRREDLGMYWSES